MPQTSTLSRDRRLDIQAEVLRHLWYEGKATPRVLARVLGRSLPALDECLDDLVRRGFIFQFIRSPQGHHASIYCLTQRTRRKIEKALADCSRYRLKSFWDNLMREQLHWLSYWGSFDS